MLSGTIRLFWSPLPWPASTGFSSLFYIAATGFSGRLLSTSKIAQWTYLLLLENGFFCTSELSMKLLRSLYCYLFSVASILLTICSDNFWLGFLWEITLIPLRIDLEEEFAFNLLCYGLLKTKILGKVLSVLLLVPVSTFEVPLLDFALKRVPWFCGLLRRIWAMSFWYCCICCAKNEDRLQNPNMLRRSQV